MACIIKKTIKPFTLIAPLDEKFEHLSIHFTSTFELDTSKGIGYRRPLLRFGGCDGLCQPEGMELRTRLTVFLVLVLAVGWYG